jgi:hypothetical protein
MDRWIAVESGFEDTDDHEAKHRSSRLSPAQKRGKRPEASRNGPPEDHGLESTRWETAARRLSQYASKRQTSDVEDRPADRDAESDRSSQRGYRGNICASHRGTRPSQDRADWSNASRRRRRDLRGGSGAGGEVGRLREGTTGEMEPIVLLYYLPHTVVHVT